MEDKNCTVAVTQSPMASTQAALPTVSSPVVERAELTTDTVPNEMGVAGGVESALNSVAGGKSETVDSELRVKTRRGRPRKHDVNGNLTHPASATSGSSTYPFGSSVKRGRGRPRGTGKLQLLASVGGFVAETAGGSFTPHVVTVHPGEDVFSTLVSFSQRGPRAVCILSATGMVSSVVIRQPCSSGGVLRCEGPFEILSLSGSYILGGVGGSHRKSGMLSISLAKADGRIIGGGVEGSLIAAGPIQLVVGSFKQNISKEIKRRHSARSSIASIVLGIPGSVRVPLQVPNIIEGEQTCPSPTSGLAPTTNGLTDHAISATANEVPNNIIPATTNTLSDNVIPVTTNGLPDNVIAATINGLPDNFISATTNELPDNIIPATIKGIPDSIIPATTNGLSDNVFSVTTDGVPDNFIPTKTNGAPDSVISATTNNVPDNAIPAYQNMHSISLNGIGLDCQALQPITDQRVSTDVDSSVPQI